MSNAYKMYSEIELTTDIMTASSHRLIELLFNKCIQKMDYAKNFILEENYISKSDSIMKAFEIIQYLRECLNHDDKKTLELAVLLDSVYVYAQRNLIEANTNNSISNIDEARKVMLEIKSGWDGIKTKIEEKAIA